MTIQEIKEKHEEDLLDKANAIAVWSGKKEVNEEETDEDAVIVGVKEKKNEEHLDLEDVVPKTLDNDVKTDVQEIGEVTAPPSKEKSVWGKIKSLFSLDKDKDRKSHWDEFPLGVSCAEKDVTAGTSGWILVDIQGEKLTVNADEISEEDDEFPSSNNHVYGDSNQAEIGSNCLQPGPYDGGSLPDDKNGELAGEVPLEDGVKVDVAWINPTRDYENELLEVGTPEGSIHRVKNGDTLRKSGRTTGVTQGKVKGAHATTRVRYPDPVGTIKRKDVIITEKMIEGGDSGDAAVVKKDGEYHPAATGFAGSKIVSVFDRIENVVKETGMKIKVGKSDGDDGEEPPEEPEAEVTLELEKSDEGRIIAHVKEKEESDGGDPIPQARVRIEGPSSEEEKTDSEGDVIFDPVPVGDYEVIAMKEGYQSSSSKRISEDDFEKKN